MWDIGLDIEWRMRLRRTLRRHEALLGSVRRSLESSKAVSDAAVESGRDGRYDGPRGDRRLVIPRDPSPLKGLKRPVLCAEDSVLGGGRDTSPCRWA